MNQIIKSNKWVKSLNQMSQIMKIMKSNKWIKLCIWVIVTWHRILFWSYPRRITREKLNRNFLTNMKSWSSKNPPLAPLRMNPYPLAPECSVTILGRYFLQKKTFVEWFWVEHWKIFCKREETKYCVSMMVWAWWCEYDGASMMVRAWGNKILEFNITSKIHFSSNKIS